MLVNIKLSCLENRDSKEGGKNTVIVLKLSRNSTLQWHQKLCIFGYFDRNKRVWTLCCREKEWEAIRLKAFGMQRVGEDYILHERVSRTNSPPIKGNWLELTRLVLYTREAVRRRGKEERRKGDFTGNQFPEMAYYTNLGG